MLLPILLAALAPAPAVVAEANEAEDLHAQLLQEAEDLRPLVTTAVARSFLDAVERLPLAEARTVWRETATGRYVSHPAESDAAGRGPDESEADESEADESDAGAEADTGAEAATGSGAAAGADAGANAGLERRDLSPSTYYLTKYGSPLAYVRAVELLGQAGVTSLQGRRVLDFGYGGLGHLRLLALCGAEAVGVDVDPFLSALYAEPDDQGPIPGDDGPGRVRLVEGRWPATAPARDAVGEGYDVVLSKNVLKRGYIHPSRSVDPRMLIDLGVDDGTMLGALHRVLKPEGLVLLYNLCPPEAADDEPYVPWADGRSPFGQEAWEAAGFELLAHDVVDDEAARRMAHLLGWGDPPDADPPTLFAWYTLARRLP